MSSTPDTPGTDRTTAAKPTPLNPFSPELIPDPYPAYERLRSEGPTYFSPVGTWVLSRYADVLTVLRDPRFGRGGFGYNVDAMFGPGPIADSFSKWMLFLNPPDHTRLRVLVTKAFTPRAVEGLRRHIQEIVDSLLDPVQDVGKMDVIADLAYPLPVMVICELLGVPAGDRERFNEWSYDVARTLDVFATPDPEILTRGNEAVRGLTQYFRELVAARRRAPRDDLLSALVAAEEEGDKLSEDELLATCVMIFFAGHETTVNLIGNGMLALLRHPGQLERLRADPGLIQSAVEELLRYDGPVQRTGRITHGDVEVGGVSIPQGQRVAAFLGAANRDPAYFPEPDRLDVARANNHHLSLGGGIHYCLGAPLARLEAQIAINTLLGRMPNLTLETDTPAWRQTAVLRGLRELPVGF